MTNQGTPWIYIVGDSILVAIRTPSEPTVVENLWALVHGGSASFDEILSAVPNTSAGQPSAFVAVERTDESAEDTTVNVLVHGDAVLDVCTPAGWRRVVPTDSPWLRDSIPSVSALAAGGLTGNPGASSGGVSFPLGSGVIVANRIDWLSATSLSTDATASVSNSTSVLPDNVLPTASPVPPADVSIAAAVASVPAPPVTPPAGPSLTHRPADGPRFAPAETETIIRPPVQRVKAQDDPMMRHDGETVLRRDIAPPIEDETVLREAPMVPNDPKTLLYGFRINGGQAYPLDAVHYFGRNPRQPRIPLPDPSRLVPVVSATKSVSATHLEIKQIGDSIVATDLKSTNGTSVIAPQSHWQRLRAGESVVVIPGTFIDIGDGNVIEILPPWPGV
ncbi:FHA domain-containing protein [Mycetocola zhadangensis]|uniref:FHA domain-containing protein n=2 Tax=Mycetocola zhadangensis TaxID=1164595 RepID=A0A3L7IWR6_9MICO|nr:FHA domain-containing protein [Mycetocola zhadangensis]GGF00395.1 hypothetical protein GCM10011313_24220 [Mycetocola zhadangensis]